MDAAMAQASARARGRDMRRGVEGGGRATACAARVAHHSLSVAITPQLGQGGSARNDLHREVLHTSSLLPRREALVLGAHLQHFT